MPPQLISSSQYTSEQLHCHIPALRPDAGLSEGQTDPRRRPPSPSPPLVSPRGSRGAFWGLWGGDYKSCRTEQVHKKCSSPFPPQAPPGPRVLSWPQASSSCPPLTLRDALHRGAGPLSPPKRASCLQRACPLLRMPVPLSGTLPVTPETHLRSPLLCICPRNGVIFPSLGGTRIQDGGPFLEEGARGSFFLPPFLPPHLGLHSLLHGVQITLTRGPGSSPPSSANGVSTEMVLATRQALF